MNGNRMKYASTPTYGMQKRGFPKKEKPTPAPDFTQAPDRNAAQGAMPAYPQGMPVAPNFAQGMPLTPSFTQSMPGATPVYPPVGSPYTVSPAMPGVSPQAAPYPMAGSPMFGGPASPMAAYPNSAPPIGQGMMAGGQNPPPLQRQLDRAQPQDAPFSPRTQGYVPPQPAASNRAMPAGSYSGGIPPMGATPATPPMQAPFAPLPYNNPYLGSMPGTPTGAPNGPGYPMEMIYPGYGQAQPRKQRKPMDRGLLVKLILFLALPALLALGLLIPALGALRYVFVGLAAISLIAIWGMKMFPQSARSALTIVYLALCCLALFGGSQTDARQASAPAQPTATPVADQAVINIDVTPEPSVSPEITPEPLGASNAEVRLSTFMELWATTQVEEMVSYVQPSWASAQGAPAKELFNLLSNRTPIEYAIEAISGSEADNSRTVTMSAKINKNNGKDPVVYRFMILMVKEEGNWYVDPKSLATNDVVTENPNATPTAGNMTMAPRVTVSPTPAPDSMLYYNPNGGSLYHADQNCPSVDKDYLPLSGSFPYGELEAHKNLEPCLQCGAPTT